MADCRQVRLYRIWCVMRNRCSNPNHSEYHRYGARGISVCQEWESYETFKSWALTNGYDDTLTIDRIDTNGNYTPDNCRWATIKEQSNNRRTCHMLTYNGKTQTLMEWAEETGLSRRAITQRLKSGWSPEATLTTPLKTAKCQHMFNPGREKVCDGTGKYTFNGETHTLAEWSRKLNINKRTLYTRVTDSRFTIEEAFTMPVRGHATAT